MFTWIALYGGNNSEERVIFKDLKCTYGNFFRGAKMGDIFKLFEMFSTTSRVGLIMYSKHNLIVLNTFLISNSH